MCPVPARAPLSASIYSKQVTLQTGPTTRAQKSGATRTGNELPLDPAPKACQSLSLLEIILMVVLSKSNFFQPPALVGKSDIWYGGVGLVDALLRVRASVISLIRCKE